MTEENADKSPAYMKAEIEMLRHMLELTISTLPQEARDFVSRRMWETQKKYQYLVDTKPTDPLRDTAAIVWDIAVSLDNRLEENAFDEFKES